MNFEILNHNQEEEKVYFKDVTELLKPSNKQDSAYLLFLEKDQKLMKSGEWDYNNKDLTINKVKDILERIDDKALSETQREEKKQILWLWNHHAISNAIKKERKIKHYTMPKKH